MSEFFEAVREDIKNRRNLELYLVLLIAIAILIADVFGLTSTSAQFDIILAALTVLIYGLLDSRHIDDRLEKKLDNVDEFIQTQKDPKVMAKDFFLPEKAIANDTFASANTIFLLGYSLSRTIREYHFTLSQRLSAGANIQVMIIDPEAESLLKMVALESTAATVENWRNSLQVTSASVNSLAQYPDKKGKVEIGYLPFPPSFGYVMIDPYEPHGFCFVDIYHHKTTAPNASFKLSKTDDGYWFDFFRTQHEKLWESCRVEDFTSG